MSNGPISHWWASWAPKQVSTADAHRVCARAETRAYCGRELKKGKVAEGWDAVSCTDCRAAYRADGGRIELIPGVVS